MRRSLFSLLTVVAIAALLVTTGCERSSVLRVASINGGNTVRSDIADFYTYFDKVDSEWVTIYQVLPDTVLVEVQYVEIGAGLPTWTPYVAVINKATITYNSADPTVTYDPAVIPMSWSVKSDPTSPKVTKYNTFAMTVVSGTWKEKAFGGDVADPPDYDILDLVDATLKISGYDSVALKTVEATGKFQIEFGNLYDDPSKLGK